MTDNYKIDPQLKDQINSEGWEDNYALLIGKKETGELNNLLEKLETEGRATNLESYIKLNKKIAVPNKETSDDLSDYVRGYFMEYWDLYYVDKEKNICKVELNPGRIDSLKGMWRDHSISKYSPIFQSELAKLGFENFNSDKRRKIESVLGKYENKLKNTEKEKIVQEFNF